MREKDVGHDSGTLMSPSGKTPASFAPREIHHLYNNNGGKKHGSPSSAGRRTEKSHGDDQGEEEDLHGLTPNCCSRSA